MFNERDKEKTTERTQLAIKQRYLFRIAVFVFFSAQPLFHYYYSFVVRFLFVVFCNSLYYLHSWTFLFSPVFLLFLLSMQLYIVMPCRSLTIWFVFVFSFVLFSNQFFILKTFQRAFKVRKSFWLFCIHIKL